MKLLQELNESLNIQLHKELHNQNTYLQISSYFETLQLTNLSAYFLKQSNHEKDHALLIMKHLNDRNGGNVQIQEIDAPNQSINSIDNIAQIYVETEELTTKSIEEIYDLALEQKSYIDLPFLLDLLREQTEEENESAKLAVRLKMCKDIVFFGAMLEV